MNNNKNILLVAIIGCVILAGVVMVLMNMQKGTTPAQKVSKDQVEVNKTGTSMLSLIPEANKVVIGQAISMHVALTGEPADAVTVSISYDPNVVQISDVRVGDAQDSVLAQKNEAGILWVTTALSADGSSKARVGNVLSFNVKGLVAGDAKLMFDTKASKTAVAGFETLKSVENATVVVK